MGKFTFLLEYNNYIDNILSHKESEYSDEYIYKSFIDNTKNGHLLLNEGLIHSQPIDTTINILKRKFNELIIKKYDDGDISIEGMTDKLSKYLPMINNLGYFISSVFIGDDKIEYKEDYLPNIECDNIFIEAKYDYEVKIPKLLFHTSPIIFKNKILKNGLTPKSGNKLSNHPNRIYLSNSLDACSKFGEYLIKSSESSDYYKDGYCIYIIKGEGVDKLYSDINLREGGFYTINNIKKEFISLFKSKNK